MKYRYLSHTADVKFRAYGQNLEEAFVNAALAMFNVMVETSKVKGNLSKKIAAIKGFTVEETAHNVFMNYQNVFG